MNEIRQNNASREADLIVGFDAKRAFRNFTGLGNYSRFVMELLTRFYPENGYCAYSSSAPDGRAVEFMASQPKIKTVYPTGIWKQFRALWRTFGITGRLERDGITVYHGLSNELPLNIRRARSVKSVVTMHDVIYLKLPGSYSIFDRTIYNFKYGRSCRNADKIIAVSECTKRDLVKHYHVSPDKVAVVYQGCDPIFREPVAEAAELSVRQKYDLPQKFILCVGTIEQRKNALTALKALKSLPGDVSLVLVGKRTKYTGLLDEYASANGLTPRLKYVHDAAFADLPAIYHMASVFVYPSRYEGFGIPVLEALCCGVPVVAAKGSCLEEAGGPGSIYLDPDDADSFAREISAILSDSGYARRMSELGLAHSENFNPEKLAAELHKVYESLIV